MTNERAQTRKVRRHSYRLALFVEHSDVLTNSVVLESAVPFGSIPSVGERITIAGMEEYPDSRMATARVREVAHSFFSEGTDDLVHQINVHTDHEEP